MNSFTPDKIYQGFCKALREEADAVQSCANRISEESVTKAVDLIANADGKRVFFGVGKSGLVARKIAATLASLNLPAVFVHAAEAVHGDLGLLESGDVGVLLSNSGETEELIALLPHLRRRSIPIIAIVGNRTSTLAREATVMLDATVDREICPLNLAPTASTAVALALGDALAATVARVRCLTRDEFALNHPSGRLGKRLTLRVGDFLHKGEQSPAIRPSATWRELVLALSEYRLGAVNVTDEQGRLLGLVTDGDLRRALNREDGMRLERLTADNLMTGAPLTVTPMVLAYDALQSMNQWGDRGISVLPVVDNVGIALGLLRLQDLIKSGI